MGLATAAGVQFTIGISDNGWDVTGFPLDAQIKFKLFISFFKMAASWNGIVIVELQEV